MLPYYSVEDATKRAYEQRGVIRAAYALSCLPRQTVEYSYSYSYEYRLMILIADNYEALV